MRIKRLKVAPEFPVQTGEWDAIWVLLGERTEGRPLESAVLRDLDWRLQGLISRYVLNPVSADLPLTYVPIESRAGIRFLVIDSGKAFSKKALESVSNGIQAKKILVWPENAALSTWLEKQCHTLDKAKTDSELQEIAWGEDSSS